MKNCIRISTFTQILLFVGIAFSINTNVFAQIDVTMKEAVALPTDENTNRWQIFVKFDKGITIPQKTYRF